MKAATPKVKPKVKPVRTVKIASATRIVRADFFEAIELDDPLPEASRPLLMTPKDAERYGLSRSTVDRMIAAGREQHARKAAREPHDNAAA